LLWPGPQTTAFRLARGIRTFESAPARASGETLTVHVHQASCHDNRYVETQRKPSNVVITVAATVVDTTEDGSPNGPGERR
jgi:hypothetical protein